MMTDKLTLSRLRTLSKKVPNWCGEALEVRIHPSMWDTAYDLPGFKPNDIRSVAEGGELGHIEFFRFILDPSIAIGSWAMPDVPERQNPASCERSCSYLVACKCGLPEERYRRDREAAAS